MIPLGFLQLDYIHNMMEGLPSALDSDSSGEESADEGEKKAVDEDDQAERENLPQYVSRFKVSVTDLLWAV